MSRVLVRGGSDLTIQTVTKLCGATCPINTCPKASWARGSADMDKPRAKPQDPETIVTMLSEQIGFWFSDANLRKDRFLQSRVGESGTGAVPLETLATFKRVKGLTSDLEVLRAAVRTRPEELSLSEDGQSVCRLRSLPTHDDGDDRTVYVEGLSPSCSHAAMRAAFAPCGAVVYVSLPRHPSGDPKCHAYVELIDAESACEAVRALHGATDGAAAELLPSSIGSGSGDGVPALSVEHHRARRARKIEYREALQQGVPEAEARERARRAAEEAGTSFATRVATEASRRNILHVLGLPKSASIKAVRRELREVIGALAPVEFVDHGFSDSGNPTIAYVRMATPDGAAEAERALRSDGLQLAKAGVTARVEVLRGERLERYTERIGDLRERTAHTRKLKRDAWWHRKYGAEGGGEESGAAEEEAGAEGDAAAPPPKRLRKDDENE